MWSGGVHGEGGLVVVISSGMLLLGALILSRRWLQGRSNGSFPPGPPAWPIIGHLHLLSSLPHQTLANLSAIYGPILGLRLGKHRAVVVSSPALARELLTTHDLVLANRPPFDFASVMMYGSSCDIVVNRYCPAWRKLRKICTLQLFTAKRLQDLEYVRQEEIRSLLDGIHDESAAGTQAVDVGVCIGRMSTNVLMRLLHSNAFGHKETGENLHKLVQEFEQEAAPTVGDFIPWLSCMDFKRKRNMRSIHNRLDKVLNGILAERQGTTQTTVSASPAYDDLLHSLMSRKVDDVSQATEESVTADEIKSVLLDMITAGIHTTILTLTWAMAELLKNPRCLERLRGEILAAMSGKEGKQVTDADVARIGYLKCVMKEVFRLHPGVPLLLPRISSKECRVQGYTLPAETQVYVNVWAIQRDGELWEKPEQFRPERFEEKEVEMKGQNYELLPFGSGRRICLGMSLGLSIVEVTLANLINHFEWELPPGQTCASINMDEGRGLTLIKATPLIALPKRRLNNNIT